MKIKSIIATLIVFSVLFNTTAVLAQFGTKTVKVDKVKFVQNVKSLFDGNVKGYEAVLLKNGQIVAEAAGGDARSKIDGQAGMTINTPSNIGSTAKFFAGVALLKIFSSPKGPLNPAGTSLDTWLDGRIYYYLPDIWKNDLTAGWKDVTFRELLQHKSGVRAFTQAELDAYKAKGIKLSPYLYFTKALKPENRKVREYQNFNFTILTFLIPMLVEPTLLQTVNKEIYEKKLKANDLYITQRLGNEFEKFMRGEVFGKITPTINPSCDAPNEYPKQNRIFALAYKYASDQTKGIAYSERVTNGSCFAQGGWFVSGHELAAFVANFAATETLLSDEVKAQMFDKDKWDDRMVWSTYYSNPWITKNLGMSKLPGMDGLQDGSRSVLIKLPDNYYALAIINSADLQPNEMAKILLASFADSASF